MKLSISFAAVVLLAGAPSVAAQKVTVDVDKTVSFANFKTFGWAEGQVSRNALVSQIIVAAVENELSLRGLRKTQDNPDIKIAVIAAVGADLQGVGPSWNNATYRSWGGQGNPAALMTITTGTLLIDLVDTKSERSVWRGVAKKTLNEMPGNNGQCVTWPVSRMDIHRFLTLDELSAFGLDMTRLWAQRFAVSVVHVV